MKIRLLYGTAVATGMVVWAAIAAASGRHEAWDSGLYFMIGMPALCVVAGTLGFIEPSNSWRWGVLPMAGQAVWMFGTQGVGNLWPLGLITLGIFAIPLIVTARIGAGFALSRHLS